jgi:maleate cis-trans isomerase
MKNLFVIFGLALSLLLIGCNSEEKKYDYTQEDVKELKNIAAEFSGELKSALMNEIRDGGIEAAVSVCSDTAQKLTHRIAEENGVDIKRVSFKTRNKLNNPDEYQKEILSRFQSMKDAGNFTDTTAVVETIEIDGEQYISFMKPIETMPLCLNCHGKNIDEEIAEIIKEKYPEDEAVGYGNDELRGAISVRKKI